ncbi:MAG: hypothetical protein ABIY62_00050, partial [Ginsengibacter sp.]
MMKKLFFITCILCFQKISAQQNKVKPSLFLYDDVSLQKNTDTIIVSPLQTLALANSKGTSIRVFDGNDKAYFSSAVKPIIYITVGGAVGKQIIRIYNQNRIVDSLSFYVDAKTNIDDGGYYK